MSAEGFLSSAWYRLGSLRPTLKPQARIRRHRFRGEVWYVIQDPASGRFNRFTPAAYQLLGLLDGERTMDDIWNAAIDQLGDDTPSQEEIIQLLSQLYAADLLQCEDSPDIAELFERFARQDRTRRASTWKNPFSIRIPLWDPDGFLTRTLPYVRPLLGWQGALLYLLATGTAVVLAALHWPELTENLSDRVLSAQNLVVLWLCFPAVKFLHELGHGYATKAGGGEVHEMGILLLVFMPVPYVDATAAAGFRGRWSRVLVGAAGMLTETFIASMFMVVWVAAEPGWLRAIAYNVLLIAGVSTLVFNVNPLLRYDGYFILSDLLEIPNLNQRGTRYWRYLAERYLFRMKVEPPSTAAGERGWLLAYTPAALVYRTLVLVAIVLFIASEWFFIGVLLAGWGVFTMFVLPVAKLAAYLQRIPRSGRSRSRAVAVSAIGLAAVLVIVLWVPMPLRIISEGVVWLPDEANVRAGVDGFVRRVLVRSGAEVEAGTPLVETDDPVLETQRQVSEARIAELEARLAMQFLADRVQAGITEEELAREHANHDRLLERSAALMIRSGVAGTVVLEHPEDLPGRHLRKGQLIGQVTQDARRIVRTVVTQDNIDLVRNNLERVDVRFAERPSEVYPAAVVREVPAAKEELPSAALTSEGGGSIAADPRDPKGGRALTSAFQFDLEVAPDVETAAFGGRAYVRFVHHPEPLANQWYRRLRQAFLGRFHV